MEGKNTETGSQRNGRTSPNPAYWWAQAQDCHEVATLLAKNCEGSMAIRKELSNQCHASLERLLKAVLASAGRLSDSLARTHSLNALVQAADLWEELDGKQVDFLKGFSGMHGKATYPDEERERQMWSSNVQMAIMVRRYGELRALFESRYRSEQEAGGQNGRDSVG